MAQSIAQSVPSRGRLAVPMTARDSDIYLHTYVQIAIETRQTAEATLSEVEKQGRQLDRVNADLQTVSTVQLVMIHCASQRFQDLVGHRSVRLGQHSEGHWEQRMAK